MTQQRIRTSLLLVIGAVLLLIIIQNPAQTTVDVLLWTLTLRQGLSLVLAFVCGALAGWFGRLAYHLLHGDKTQGRRGSGSVPSPGGPQSIHTT